jgi:hypothetical protein
VAVGGRVDERVESRDLRSAPDQHHA